MHPDTAKRLNSINEFKAALGDFIIAWNNAENSMRVLLATICGHSDATNVLTVELGSRGLTEALKAMARFRAQDQRGAIEFVVELYDRIQPYRNYYVHGIRVFMFNVADFSAIGVANQASAKGHLRVSEDQVLVSDLTAMSNHCANLQDAISAIVDTIDPQPGSRVWPHLPSKEVIPLPDILKKKLRYYPTAQPPL